MPQFCNNLYHFWWVIIFCSKFGVCHLVGYNLFKRCSNTTLHIKALAFSWNILLLYSFDPFLDYSRNKEMEISNGINENRQFEFVFKWIFSYHYGNVHVEIIFLDAINRFWLKNNKLNIGWFDFNSINWIRKTFSSKIRLIYRDTNSVNRIICDIL